jgi:nicotinamidase/pyrazinamidase
MTAAESVVRLERGDALVIVDLQYDFLPPNGALAVPSGNEVIPVLNSYISLFNSRHLGIFATRDWHPANHCSFKTRGGPWPVHCVMNSHGAAFTTELKLPLATLIISKPSSVDRETYSAFEGTDFDKRLRTEGVRRVFVGGLATDYCVLHTVKDALKSGFKTFYLRDASRAVNVRPDDGRRAEAEMQRLGAMIVDLEHVAA